MNKKGIALGDMPNVVMTLIIVAAFLVGGFLAIEGIQAGLTANSNADNATDVVITGLSNTTDQIDTVGTLIGVGLLLAVIGGAFVVGRRFM